MMNTKNILIDCFNQARNHCLLGIGIIFILLPLTSFAATKCTISSITSVNFGTYDVFSTRSNNNGIGSVTIDCQGGGPNLLVTLSSGQSNSYVSRIMRSNRNSLSYNLYTSAARNIIWGDGTGGSSTMMANKNSTTTLNVFGQIAAGQDVAVGTYTDIITTIIIF